MPGSSTTIASKSLIPARERDTCNIEYQQYRKPREKNWAREPKWRGKIMKSFGGMGEPTQAVSCLDRFPVHPSKGGSGKRGVRWGENTSMGDMEGIPIRRQ